MHKCTNCTRKYPSRQRMMLLSPSPPKAVKHSNYRLRLKREELAHQGPQRGQVTEIGVQRDMA